MFYLARPDSLKDIWQKSEDYAGNYHIGCAMAFVCHAFYHAPILTHDALVEICEQRWPRGRCFSHGEFDFAWRYLIDEGLINPIEIIATRGRHLYVCAHRGIATDYYNRRRLCDECRAEIITREPPADGNGLMILEAAKFIEGIDKYRENPPCWPDEID